MGRTCRMLPSGRGCEAPVRMRLVRGRAVLRGRRCTRMPLSNERARSSATGDRVGSRTLGVCCTVGLLGVLCFLTGFSIVTQQSIAARSRASDRANRLAATYSDARFWVGQAESLERKYRLEPSAIVRAAHTRAEDAVERDLEVVQALDPSSARSVVAVGAHECCVLTRGSPVVRRGRRPRPRARDPTRPCARRSVFAGLEDSVYGSSARSSASALRASAALRDEQGSATRTIALAFAVGLGLIIAFGGILIGLRRRLGRRASGRSLRSAIARTDALTGLRKPSRVPRGPGPFAPPNRQRNGLGRSPVLRRCRRSKVVNDTHGHPRRATSTSRSWQARCASRPGDRRGVPEAATSSLSAWKAERAMDALDVVARLNIVLSSGAPSV